MNNPTRRQFLAAAAAGSLGASAVAAGSSKSTARVAITLDLEMSRHYPRRGMMEWDYQKGNLDKPTKDYALAAARLAAERGVKIHFFCVGRVLEQPDIDWLKEISRLGHPVGNHTYDHVNVWATTPEDTQFRFQRASWLVKGKTVEEVLRQNIRVTTTAMKQRAGITPAGFRTPGGRYNGLLGRQDLQQMLLDEGFRWVSSKYPRHHQGTPRIEPTAEVYQSIVEAQQRAQPFVYPTGLVEIPMSPVSDVNAFRSNFWKLEYFLKAIRLAVDWAIGNGGVFDFLAHPSCLVVEDPNLESIRLICDLAKASGDKAQIVDLDSIAATVQK